MEVCFSRFDFILFKYISYHHSSSFFPSQKKRQKLKPVKNRRHRRSPKWNARRAKIIRLPSALLHLKRKKKFNPKLTRSLPSGQIPTKAHAAPLRMDLPLRRERAMTRTSWTERLWPSRKGRTTSTICTGVALRILGRKQFQR